MANEIACWLAVDPQLRLVLATSLASIAYLFGARMKELPQRFSWLERVSSVSLMLGPLMIASSSAALLANGWIDPIGSGQYADQFSTLAVATWWIVGAVAFFLRANRRLESVSGLLSSLLAPASAVLVVPVFYQFNPIVWFQVAAIVSAVWWLAAYWLMDREQSEASELAISLSAGFVMIAGIGSAVLALMHTVFNLEEVESTLGFPGVCISMIAIGYWCVIGLRSSRGNDSGSTRLPWFAGIALIAGQIGWLSAEFGLVSGIEVVELVSAVWLATSIAALLRHDQNRLAAVHIVAISGLLLIVDADAGMQSDRTPPLAIAGLCSVGCLVAFATWSVNRSVASCIAYRILGWFVVVSGGYLLTSRCGLPQTEEIFWTVIIGWASLWVLLWRTLASRVLTEEPRISAFRLGPIPDMEFAILLGFAALVEAILSASAGIDIYPRNITDPLLIARVISLTLVAASVLYRADRTDCVDSIDPDIPECGLACFGSGRDRLWGNTRWAVCIGPLTCCIHDRPVFWLDRSTCPSVVENLRGVWRPNWIVSDRIDLALGVDDRWIGNTRIDRDDRKSDHTVGDQHDDRCCCSVGLGRCNDCGCRQSIVASTRRRFAGVGHNRTLGKRESCRYKLSTSDGFDALVGCFGLYDPDGPIRFSEVDRDEDRFAMARRADKRGDGRRDHSRSVFGQYADQRSDVTISRWHPRYFTNDGDWRCHNFVDS